MSRTLVVGTKNPAKLEEIAAILGDLDVDLRSLADCGDVATVPETGETFEANAREKALGYARATGEWALADDSGLDVDALGGSPGVYSSRWGGEEANDGRNNEKLIEALREHPEPWTARYRCVVAVATPEKVILTAEGACEGRIVAEAAGSGGFGYDPHFYLDDRDCTMAQLAPEEKNAISHRGEALRRLRTRLATLL